MNSQPFCYKSYIIQILNRLSNYAIKVSFCSVTSARMQVSVRCPGIQFLKCPAGLEHPGKQ